MDMISEANATKAALKDATNDVVASVESMKVQEPPSSQLNGVNDADLFGFGNTETVESAPAPIAPETPVQNSYAPAPVPESAEQPPAAYPEYDMADQVQTGDGFYHLADDTGGGNSEYTLAEEINPKNGVQNEDEYKLADSSGEDYANFDSIQR